MLKLYIKSLWAVLLHKTIHGTKTGAVYLTYGEFKKMLARHREIVR